MSVRILSRALDATGLNSGEKLVLVILADFADDDGVCWPSMGTVAGKANMTDRGVRGIIRRLEDAGHVTTRGSQGRAANRYIVHPNAEPASVSNAERRAGSTRNDVPGPDTNPERNSAQPGTAVPPNRQEPPKETEAVASVASRSASRGTRIPDAFPGTIECRWAVDAGLPPDRVRVEAAKFTDYWRGVSGHRGVKADWPATWRNWCRKALDDLPKQGGGGGRQRKRSALAESIEDARRADERRAAQRDVAGDDGGGAAGDLLPAGRGPGRAEAGACHVAGCPVGPAAGGHRPSHQGAFALAIAPEADPWGDQGGGNGFH